MQLAGIMITLMWLSSINLKMPSVHWPLKLSKISQVGQDNQMVVLTLSVFQLIKEKLSYYNNKK